MIYALRTLIALRESLVDEYRRIDPSDEKLARLLERYIYEINEDLTDRT